MTWYAYYDKKTKELISTTSEFVEPKPEHEVAVLSEEEDFDQDGVWNKDTLTIDPIPVVVPPTFDERIAAITKDLGLTKEQEAKLKENIAEVENISVVSVEADPL